MGVESLLTARQPRWLPAASRSAHQVHRVMVRRGAGSDGYDGGSICLWQNSQSALIVAPLLSVCESS